MSAITPTNTPSTPMSMPSATLSLTDWHTWIGILTSVASIVAVVFHTDLSAYVPLASIAASTVVLATLMIVKHKYASALATVTQGITQAQTVAPSTFSAELENALTIAKAVQNIQGTMSAGTYVKP